MHPDQAASADAAGIAETCERVVMLAALAGLDCTAASRIAFAFDASGDVTITVTSTDGTSDTGTVTAADLAAYVDPDESGERPSTPPPPAA